MKYYKNLWKNKRWTFWIILVWGLLGICMFGVNLYAVIMHGVLESGMAPNVVVNNGMAGILSITNIGLVIVGLINMFFAFYWLPVVSPIAQDSDEFTIKEEDEKLYIKFRNYEIVEKKNNFNVNSLIWSKDKNGKFISMTKAYQIYNYVANYLKKDGISIMEIPTKFQGLRPMSKEEKENYIQYKNIKNNIKIGFMICAIFLYSISILGCLGMILQLFQDFTTARLLLTLFMILIFAVLSFLAHTCLKISRENKKLIWEVKNNNVLIGDCYLETKGYFNENGESYGVKVKDKKQSVYDWIYISKSLWDKVETEPLKLVVLEHNPKLLVDVVPKNM